MKHKQMQQVEEDKPVLLMQFMTTRKLTGPDGSTLPTGSLFYGRAMTFDFKNTQAMGGYYGHLIDWPCYCYPSYLRFVCYVLRWKQGEDPENLLPPHTYRCVHQPDVTEVAV